MKIGIIGLGVVGGAIKHGFEKIGHQVSFYDKKYPETSLDHVMDTELAFITVPTPQFADGSCDTSIVESVVGQLAETGYGGVAVIKSTVVPGLTDRLAERHAGLRLAFCPEFLRERAAIVDFVENHDLCVIGTHETAHFETIKEAHGWLPKKTVHLTPLEAELTKYFSNVFNALRVIFANEFYDVCQALGANYAKIKNAMVQRTTISDAYLDCSESFRGFGGVCLPKDTAAFAALVKQLNLDLKLFETIVEENKKFKRTVFEGMREDAEL